MLKQSVNHSARARMRRNEAIEFRILVAVAVAPLLIAVVSRRALLRIRHPLAGAPGAGESCYAEARRLAHSAIPFAFMG